MTNRSSDDIDLDNTDELPILLEPVEDAAGPFPVARHEDTAEHTELFAAAASAEGSEAPIAELLRTEQIQALEAQIRVLSDSARDLEQRLAEKDERLEELRATLASAPKSTGGPTATEARLATELADRDAQIVELRMAIEHLEQTAAAGSTELEQLRETAKNHQSEGDELRRALAARALPDATHPGDDLREAYATLRSYVAARRAWWDEMEQTNARLARRATELEQELAASAKSLAAAEAFAAKESGRAVELRAELVASARRVDALERELKLLRAPAELESPALMDGADSPRPTEAPPAPPSAPTLDAAVPDAAARDAALAHGTPPLLTDAVDAVPPTVEAIAQLEAEIEYKRQQVAAQLVELRDRELKVHAAMNEVGALRSELDDSRSNVAQLERTVVDKDRALDARDARIAALHEELKQRPGGVEKRGAVEFSLPTMDATSVRRAGSHDGAVDNSATPVLICLTGDAPKRFALTKKTVTVGRGPHCDLQIITHFVSREHARLTVSGGETLIEDLGSRNGVFVNSVRVDRRHLQQGDLVTIGETQFRFVESMAH